MNNNKMFEPRTVFALTVAFAGIFAWQYFVTKMYPPVKQPESVSQVSGRPTPETPKTAPGTTSVTQSAASGSTEIKQTVVIEEKFFPVEARKFTASLSSFGMGLKNVELNEFLDRSGHKVKLGDDSDAGLFAMRVSGQTTPLNFDIKKVSETEYQGTHKSANLEIVRTLKFEEGSYRLLSEVTVKAGSQEAAKGLEVVMTDKIMAPASSHFLFPSYDLQDFVVKQSGKIETVNYSATKENFSKSFPAGSMLSLGSQYFTAALVDKSDLIPEVFLTAVVKESKSLGGFKYLPVQVKDDLNLKQTFYVGPKVVESLRAADAEFVEAMNYGMFGFLAHPILILMKWLHQIVGNWGFAIILLTLVVRVIVLPFNLVSFKSMKAMQKIQPLLQSAREKYKDDPMAMNRETMAIMKLHKANPLSGCLPMLIQIPVFFALYRVIASSIEIYQQPFVGWINDLSLHDKFFVLPILMGVTMAIQQKITPTTMDPAQAKILMFMPILFTGLMIFLPSGLTLYMFISALFGITQQYFFMKTKTA